MNVLFHKMGVFFAPVGRKKLIKSSPLNGNIKFMKNMIFILSVLFGTLIFSGCKQEVKKLNAIPRFFAAEGFKKITVTVPEAQQYNHLALLAVDSTGNIIRCASTDTKNSRLSGDIVCHVKLNPDGFILDLNNLCEIKAVNYRNLKSFQLAQGSVEYGEFFLKGTTEKDAAITTDFQNLAADETGFTIVPVLWLESTEVPDYCYPGSIGFIRRKHQSYRR